MLPGIKTIGSIATAAMIFCGAAQATEYNINIYGASAQYKFWNSQADDFLTNIKGCTTVQQAEERDVNNNPTGVHGITYGTGCDNGHSYYIRYTSKASYDGIYACKGDTTAPNPDCSTFGPKFRKMANENNTDWANNKVNGTVCKEVTIGASDVSGKAFGQSGPLGTSVPAIDTTLLDPTAERPFAITFGFFKNRNDFPELKNISRLQALMIFSGKASYWNQFGTNEDCDEQEYTYPNKRIRVCLRSAGSGTHATLDRAVMRSDQNLINAASPVRIFNSGSSGMMACINTNTPSYASIGYADADQREETWNCIDKNANCDGIDYNGAPADLKYPNVEAIRYEGVVANAANVAHCKYSFWSAQWLYKCDGDPNGHTSEIGEFAKTNGNYYNASRTDLETNRCKKDSDFVMPTFY